MSTYMKCLRNTVLKFLDIFNNIRINKYDQSGVITRSGVTVPVKFATKEKSYQWALDKQHARAMPMIAIEHAGITHLSDQKTGANRKIVFDKNIADKSYSYFYNPAPYSLDMMVHIIARYATEMDQILEQILSVFNPYIMTRIKISDYSNETIDIKIVFTGASPTHTSEMDEIDYRILQWTLNFTVYTYMFKPAETVSPETSGGLITAVIDRFWMGNDETTMTNAISAGDMTNDQPSASGYTLTLVTSGLGYDDSAAILYSYEVFEHDG